MLELCRQIKPLKMRWMSQCAIQIADNPKLLKAAYESGCYVLSFGLESINKSAMKEINKNWADPNDYIEIIKRVNKAGIEIASEMIIGLDTDTVESLDATIDFVKKSNIIAPKFYCFLENTEEEIKWDDIEEVSGVPYIDLAKDLTVDLLTETKVQIQEAEKRDL